ncbi:cell surface glycoprotein CD200 receptor 1 isoform X2 [Apus apus]|uniref:cell surface glycoprotein CD200 receptor 1 isoform X2 n=1 Tax=Apus apus TaxID=8895 RepID=UPI0021F8C10D|nr:cell surface glycoprotein CD200 receptor 1 isoform X2 [Apus apus]
MMGSSQQAGWCKKPTSLTSTRATLKAARKTMCTVVLLTITVVTGAGEFKRVSVTIGKSPVLICPHKLNVTMVTWKISPKVGGPCTLGYRADHNKTDRTNCSDSMNWKSRPDWDPALEIRQVGIAHEGNYTCEVVTVDGNFPTTYLLSVLVPPRLSLYCDGHGSHVCEAAAGKPAAWVWWVPGGNSTPKEESHGNGTVTVLSKFTAHNTSMTNATCVMFHPAGNQSKSITCHPSGNNFVVLSLSIVISLLIIIIFMAVICYFKIHSDRQCHKTKPLESAPTLPPEDDTMEVEPYTTYVQKENVIYNSVSDLTVGQNLPQGLWPPT